MNLAVIDTTTGQTVRTVRVPGQLAVGEVIINPKAQRYDAQRKCIVALAVPVEPVRVLIANLTARVAALEAARQAK